MTEKTQVVFDVKEPKVYSLLLKTPNGEAEVIFNRLKKNEFMKWQIDMADRDGFTVQKWSELCDLALSKVFSVTNLFDDGEPVTVEQIRAGEISEHISDAIVQGFWAVSSKERSERKYSSEAEEKKSDSGDGSQDGSSAA